MTEQLAPDEGPAAVVVPGPWGERDASWGFIYELPASVEYGLAEDEPEPSRDGEPAAAEDAAGWQPLVAALADLTRCVEDERRERLAAQAAVRRARDEIELSRVQAAQLAAELDAERSRRHEVAAELEAERARAQELLEHERRRVEVLEGERAALVKRLEEQWAGAPSSRRSRPLRPLHPPDMTAELPPGATLSAEEEMEAAAPELAMEPEPPEMAEEIERLRERLRSRLHKPPDLPTVEAGVDRLRESRLAREREHEPKHKSGRH
jgi:chromosome segregation ATPase